MKSNAPGRGQKPVEAITFYPKHQIQFENERSIKGFDETMMLKEPIKRLLKEKYGFTWVELQTTFDILYKAQKTMTGADEDHPSLAVFLDGISRKALQAEKPQKYVIGAIKKHLKERYNIVFKSKKELAAEEKLRRMATERNKKNAPDEPKMLGDLMK